MCQAPLFLPLFSLLPSCATFFGRLMSIVLYTALDLLSANCLYEIAASGVGVASSKYTSPRKDESWKPVSVAAVYLLNPFTLLTCLARPTTVFTTFFVLLSIRHATQGKPTTTAFALALASYTSLHPLLLLPPIGLLCYDQIRKASTPPPTKDGKIVQTTNQQTTPLAFTLSFLGAFLTTTTLLLLLSRLILPSYTFLQSLYLTPLSLPDLTPNPGLWWYFFTEMFDAFRSFFLGVFWLHMLAYSVPFTLRLRNQPLAAVIAMLGVLAIFQPYANVGEVGAWLATTCLMGHVFSSKSSFTTSLPTTTITPPTNKPKVSSTHRYPFPALAALLYATLLGPAFHYLWLYAGSGNANFFYAITLVWNLALLILETDLVYASLRDEWESERPGALGKVARQI
jgi:phosphatidylinositol glycan class U